MAVLRQLTSEAFDEKLALEQYAFQFRLSPETIEEERGKYKPERDWGLFDEGEGGKLLSKLTLLPLEAWVQGRPLAMGGIAGVASWPHARRRGGVRELMLRALREMKDAGQTISMLMPFAFEFYRKFGYEMTIERKAYTLETRHLPVHLRTSGAPGRVELEDKSSLRLPEVYEAYAAGFNGMLKRDEERWRRALDKSPFVAVYYGDSGRAEGYMLYDVKDRVMTVHERVELTRAAADGLWAFAANHDSMIERLTMIAPLDDPLPFLVPDPRFKQEIVPYFMTRIVDLAGFAERYAFAPAAREESLRLTVSDRQAPWNDGAFRLTWTPEGSARLEPLGEATGAAGGGGAAPAASCDIGALAALLTGGRSARMLRRAGRLEAGDEAVALLERRVPARTPYLLDFF